MPVACLEHRTVREVHSILCGVTPDHLVIGLAFAQMILEGRVHPGVRPKALWAVERQALDAVRAFAGGSILGGGLWQGSGKKIVQHLPKGHCLG